MQEYKLLEVYDRSLPRFEHPPSIIPYDQKVSGRWTTSYCLPVLPTAADTPRLLEKLEEEACRVLAKARIEKWPTSAKLVGREYLADQTLWNTRCARYYLDKGDPLLAMYFAVHAGQTAASMSLFRRYEQLFQVECRHGRLRLAGHKSGDRRRTPARRRRALKRYAELRRSHEKAEAAKRQCAREFKVSRATISRWIKDEKDRRKGVLEHFHRLRDGDSEEYALEACKKHLKVPPRTLKRWLKDQSMGKSGLTKGS